MVPGAFWKDEEEMVSTQLTKWDEDERIRQLAGEIVIRAIQDIRLLQRRGVLDGIKITGETSGLRDCSEYTEPEEVEKLVSDFQDGTVLFWCRVAGVEIDQRTLNRVIERSNKWNTLHWGRKFLHTESRSSSPLGSQSASWEVPLGLSCGYWTG